MDFNIKLGKSSRTNDTKVSSLNKADHSRAVKRATIRSNTHHSPRYDKHLVFDRQQRVKKKQSLFKTSCSPSIVAAPATIKAKERSVFTLELPPNLSHKDRDQNYMITLDVSSNQDGNITQATIAKVHKCKDETLFGMCSICWDNPCDTIFLPCGHLSTCHGCASKTLLCGRKCPMCRATVANINKVYHGNNHQNEV
jgi:hypothetical protein